MKDDIDYKQLYLQQVEQTHKLVEQNDQLLEILKSLQAQYQESQLLIQKLNEQIEQLLRARFGKKSERKVERRRQSKEKIQPEEDEVITRQLPEALIRETIEHDVDALDKTCSHCQIPLTPIKSLEREVLAYRQASLYVKKHCRLRYACRRCQKTIVTAKPPNQVIEKGIADSSLLAQIIIDKYQDALPLYRQEQRWSRLGFALPRQTLCEWTMQCATWLDYLVQEMKKDILAGRKISSDDTVFPIQAPGKTHTGRLWVYIGGGGNAPPIAVVYEYTKTRSHQGPLTFLQDFQGYLQADAYPGYDKVFESGKVIEVACFAHCRRKFVEAYECGLQENAASLSKIAIDLIAELYSVEHFAKQMTPIARYYYRKQHAKPWLKKLQRFLNKYQHQSLPKSLLGKAIQYALNHWRALTNYCRDGTLDIDNNISERAIKPFVIGRKNYLFAGSHDGARAAATIYSIIETCKMFGINTYDYLFDVLTRLPNTLNKDIRQLLPYHWKPSSCN